LKDLLLITPPFTQLNTPYPATAYLKGFLNTKGFSSFQMDLGIEVILQLFTEKELKKLFESANSNGTINSANAHRIYSLRNTYIQTIDHVISFLQGKNLTFARQICSDNFLPQASRFEQLDDLEYAFGNMGMQDKAKHLATLYLEDLSDFIVETTDEHFGFSRYAERLGRSANSFDELYNSLLGNLSYVDNITLEILNQKLQSVQPKLVCLSVPFPGNLYSAFRCAQFIKSNFPNIKIAMGGGFPNTELRSLSDARVFEFFDFITLDDGELPIELLVKHVVLKNPDSPTLKRTFICEKGEVKFINNATLPDYKQSETGTPDYSDLQLDQYISVIEIANPMHSLWSDGRWNKLTMAHGCYWGKCTFCDISLDYIKLYEPIAAKLLVSRMEQIIEQTGEKGFHFVDEAAPPALMREMALEILRRNLTVTWWTNIRFEKSFSRELCLLLKASGCIAVSGGLEVASDRLLALIQKGVTVEQVAKVTANFTDAGIMVHAYLMYGYPTQTIQETVDSLEMVRQLFELGVIQSGFWHQFALTAHSPVGLNPKEYGITPHYQDIKFANNDILFTDSTGVNHEQFSFGLKKSLFNYMHGIGFDIPLNEWFDFKTLKTTIQNNYILNCLENEEFKAVKPSTKIIWLGNSPEINTISKKKKGIKTEFLNLTFHDSNTSHEVVIEKDKAEWLLEILPQLSVQNISTKNLSWLKTAYEKVFPDFELFWYSTPVEKLKEAGLLTIE
jgi:hypothetical protein